MSDIGGSALILGNGFIGSAAAASMIDHFQSVRMIARSPRASDAVLSDQGIQIVYPDTSEDYWKLTAEHSDETDIVVSAIGTASPTFVEDNYAHELSQALSSATRVAEILRKRPTLRSIYVSSGGCVYGESPNSGSLESDELRPRGNYGLLHSNVERLIEGHNEEAWQRSSVVRISNPYGPQQVFSRGQGFVAYVEQQIRNMQPVTLLAGGDQIRDFVQIDDVGQSIALLAASPKAQGLYNVGTSVGTSNRDVAELIAGIMKRDVRFTSAPGRHFDVQQNILDNSRITADVGMAFMPLEQGLRKALGK